MSAIIIEGNKNVANTGVIQGNCITNSTVIYFKLKVCAIMDEKEMSLVNMTDAQKKLAAAIEKFAQVEITRAEADVLRARAEENNSLANLNYSKIMLEDRVIIKQLMSKITK